MPRLHPLRTVLRFATALLLGTLPFWDGGAAPCGGEDPAPAGFRQVLKSRDYVVWTDRDEISNEKVEKTLQDAHAKFRAFFALDKEVLGPGPEGAWRNGLIPDPIEILLCRDEASYQTACGASSSQGLCTKIGTIGQAQFHRLACLSGNPAEAFDAESLKALRHGMSHVFYARCINLGEPTWLNEGLAEFLRVADGVQSRMEAAAPREILDRLGKREGPLKPVSELTALPQTAMDRDRLDEAWLLVDYLLRTRPRQMSEFLNALAGLDRQATDPSCRDDFLAISASVFKGLFPDPPALDRALASYLEDLLKDPGAKAQGEPAVGKAFRPGFRIASTLSKAFQETDVLGKKTWRRSVQGSITNGTSFACAAQAQFGFGDDAGNWGHWLELTNGSVPPGKTVPFKEYITITPGTSPGKMTCVAVSWRAPKGGQFISRIREPYR